MSPETTTVIQKQMNAGAENIDGEILYFVHADAIPPNTFVQDIHKVIGEGYESGCYRFAMDSDKLLLKINSWFTRFNRLKCREVIKRFL